MITFNYGSKVIVYMNKLIDRDWRPGLDRIYVGTIEAYSKAGLQIRLDSNNANRSVFFPWTSVNRVEQAGDPA